MNPSKPSSSRHHHHKSRSSTSRRHSSSHHHKKSHHHASSSSSRRHHHQKIPKFPQHPLRHLGVRKNASKMESAAKSVYLPPKRLSFHSAIPEIPLEPFSYYMPSTDSDASTNQQAKSSLLSKFSKYHTSYLEVNFKHRIETEKDMGIKINLNEYMKYKVFEQTEESSMFGASSSRTTKSAPLDVSTLHKDDRELLSMESSADDYNAQRRDMLNVQEPWLRRNKYMDYKDHATSRRAGITSRSSAGPVQGVKARSSQSIKTQAELRQDVENSFNFKIPETHASKPGVVPRAVMDFVPNYDLWGTDFVKVTFDTDTLPSSTFQDKSEQEREQMQLALGNRLYRGGILDRNFTKQEDLEFGANDQVDYALPPPVTYADENPYEVDKETEYQFVRPYNVKALHNPNAKQVYSAASGQRNFTLGYVLTLNPMQKTAQYFKLSNDVQLNKKAVGKSAANSNAIDAHLQALEEKPQVFVRGRDLTTAERDHMEKKKESLEPEMADTDLF